MPTVDTADATAALGLSAAASQTLGRLARAGLVNVSLQTALHRRGLIEQIPEVIYSPRGRLHRATPRDLKPSSLTRQFAGLLVADPYGSASRSSPIETS